MTRVPLRTLAPPAVLLLVWALLSSVDGLALLDLIGGLAAVAAGVLLAVLAPPAVAVARRVLDAADDLLGEGGAGGRDRAGSPSAAEEEAGDPDRLDARAPADAAAALLAALADELRAHRIVVWGMGEDTGRITPVHVHGEPVREQQAAGSPLAWAASEGQPIRLDPAPRWARGATTAAPVDGVRVMTVETAADAPADPAAVARAARTLAPFLALHDSHADALAATARLHRVVELLRSAPRQTDPARMPEALAAAAADLTGADGAAVASWSGEEGLVLVRIGQGGGPRPGTAFKVTDGDLSHAARTGVPVRRVPDGSRRPPLAARDERWERPEPPYRVTVPLVDPAGTASGAVAVWADSPPAEQGITLLEALGPLFALQLAQAGDLARYRARATRDPLTGLPNRAALDERLAEEGARFHRYRRPLASMVIDLDHFKRINDTWGHDAGDLVLRRIADVLERTIRDVDFPARFGGEELVVLMPETLLRPALEVAERVRAAIEAASIEHDGQRIPVTASIGVSGCPECVDDPEELFTSADQALYVSKEEGRNRITAAGVRLPAATRPEPR